MKHVFGLFLVPAFLLLLTAGACRAAGPLPFKPGEKFHYSVYLADFPAGDITLAVQPMAALGGAPAYHFVMTASLSPILKELLMPADRVESYADEAMTHALLYAEYADGSSRPGSTVTFDWQTRQARYRQGGKQYRPSALQPGAFDPLSLLYALRLVDLAAVRAIARPVSNGLRCAVVRAAVLGRQRVSLESGQHAAYLVEAPLAGFFDMFAGIAPSATLKLWISDDARRLPLRLDCAFPVGTCRVELRASGQ